MTKQGRILPARRPRAADDDESLLIRSAESLGRMIGSLQRQLDGASRMLGVAANGSRATAPESAGHERARRAGGSARTAARARKGAGSAATAKRSGATATPSAATKKTSKSAAANKTATTRRPAARKKAHK
jgi:hypothetical protein